MVKDSLLGQLRKITLNAVVTFLHYAILVSAVWLIAYSSFMWLTTLDVWGLGGVFWSSWITFGTVYLGVAIFLRINGVSVAERFIISLTSTISMIWLYEILYHFSYWNSWNYGIPPYFLLKSNTIFLFYGLIALTALSGYKYMKVNRWFWIVFLAMASVWIFWITMGFPQFESPNVLFESPLPRLIIDNPHVFAFPLYAVTKFLLGLAYVLLYLPSREKLAEAKVDLRNFLIQRGVVDDGSPSEYEN